jgi:hypothetical protein
LIDDEQRWIEIDIPAIDTRIALFQLGEDLKPGGNMNLTFSADDVESMPPELKSKVVEFVMVCAAPIFLGHIKG